MYSAIEAVAKGGVVEPLEHVKFDEDEHVLIVRLSKPLQSPALPKTRMSWREVAGSLKASPNFNNDPLTIQQDLRDEWN